MPAQMPAGFSPPVPSITGHLEARTSPFALGGTALPAAEIQAIFDQNVGVASVENPDMKLVDPGHPEASFLMFKLDGVECDALTCAKQTKNACKDLMPLGNTKPMDADKREIVRRWIKQGAKND